MKLLDKDGNEAEIGKTYLDFRGDPHVLKSIGKPRHSASTGRVNTDIGEFYPSVLGFKWSE